MGRVILAIGTYTTGMWLLLYLNEILPPGTWWGLIIHLCGLIYPSLGLWALLLTHRSWGTPITRTAVSLWILSGVAILADSTWMSVGKPLDQGQEPVISSLVGSTYTLGLVLTLATLVWFPRSREYVLRNRSLGQLAVALALVLFGLNLIARIARPELLISNLSAFRFLSVLFLVILLSAFLCLLNVSRTQRALGLVTFGGLLLAQLVRAGVLLSLWQDGRFYWPLLILVTLILETMVIRRSRLWARILGQ